jgi:hypothetical protein
MTELGNCKAMAIGSLPFTDANAAWEAILENFPKIPCWPQLPKRSYTENMYLQYSEHIPGRIIDTDNQRFYIDNSGDLQPEMEKFYNAYLTEDVSALGMSREYVEGLYTALDMLENNHEVFAGIEFIKGQITGPVSFGLQVVFQDKKSIYYDEIFHDILLKNIERKAQWQEKTLQKINKNTIISVDEPYLSSIGSGVINLNREQVISDLDTIFKSLTGLKASHCCGNTDWSLLLKTSADILLFDAYNYSKNLALFATELNEFLSAGGRIGWGIVPSIGQELETTNTEKLVKLLEDGIQLLVDKGIERDMIIRQSMITPSCGLGPLNIEQATSAMQLTKSVSDRMRQKYELE